MKTARKNLKFLNILFVGLIMLCAAFGLQTFLSVSSTKVQTAMATGTTVYLDPTNGADSNNGSTKALALQSLNAAITAAGENGTIIVCSTITLTEGATIDFHGITFERYFVSSSSYASGNIFSLSGDAFNFSNLTLDGKTPNNSPNVNGQLINTSTQLTLTNARLTANSYGGVYTTTQLNLDSCEFFDFPSNAKAVGLNAESANLTAVNCKFYSNSGVSIWKNSGGNINVSDSIFGGYIDENENGIFDEGEQSLGNTNSNINVGGIYCSTNLTNCSFLNNTVGGSDKSTLRVTRGFANDCLFLNNSSGTGGAAHLDPLNGSFSFKNCVFEKNKSTSNNGGAIYVSRSTCYVRGCTFKNNTAQGNGGAIFTTNNAGVTIQQGCTFVENSTINGDGGAICAGNGYVLRLYDSTFTQNSSRNGGAICANGAISFYGSVVIENNTGTGYGGGVYDANCSGYGGDLSYIKIYDNYVNGNQNNYYFGKQTTLGIAQGASLVKTSSKIGIYLGDVCCSNSIRNQSGVCTIFSSQFEIPQIVLDRTTYEDTTNSITYTIALEETFSSGATYPSAKVAKFFDVTDTSALQYTASSYSGPYDGSAHGVSVQVYNAAGATVEYSLVDFGSATSSDIKTTSPTVSAITSSPVPVYVRISATGFTTVTTTAYIRIFPKNVFFDFTNAIFKGEADVTNITANTTEISPYLKGVKAVDDNDVQVYGSFYLTSNYAPTASSFALSSNNIKFIPNNSDYSTIQSAISSNITPVLVFQELYSKNSKFYATKSNADNNANALSNTTLSTVLMNLKNNGTIYFLSPFVVSGDDEVVIDADNVTYSGYAADSSNFLTNSLISISSGKTLTISTTNGGKLTIKGASTSGTCNSLIVSAGNLTISGDVTIKDCNSSSGDTNSNGGAIYSTGTLNLTSIKFTNLSAATGGAIYATGESTLTDCSFTNCSATAGGAIYAGNTLTVENCAFGGYEDANGNGTFDSGDTSFGNSSSSNDGGAILFSSANKVLTVTNSTFVKNSSTGNGGAINATGNLNVDNCYFYFNTANSWGGAINIGADSTLSIAHSNFIKNSSKYGGAICVTSSTTAGELSVEYCTFDHNSSTSDGGAMYVGRKTVLYVDSSTFTYNITETNGGAIAAGYTDNEAEISNCVFLNNSAGTYGGAVYANVATVTNSIFNTNSSAEGGAIYGVTALVLQDCIFNNNTTTSNGGAIKAVGTLDVDNCSFTKNSAASGGAIKVNGAATINNSTFGGYVDADQDSIWDEGETSLGNVATNFGGAIYSTASLTIRNTNFVGNKNISSAVGGAIYKEGSTGITLENCSFYKNISSNNGGAVFANSAITASYCSFTENTAGANGGAICSYASNEELFFNYCTFNGNTATMSGGALTIEGNTTFTGCTFTNNSSTGNNNPGGGGAIYFDNANKTLTIENCAFDGNSAVKDGGAVHSMGTTTVDSSIFTQNSSYNGGAIYATKLLTITGSTFGGYADANKNGVWDDGETGLGNTTTNGGGAVFASKTSQTTELLTVTDCNFIGNIAGTGNSSSGGAVYISGGELSTLTNCIFYKNSVTGEGGAVVSAGPTTIQNCTFTDNSATSKGGAVSASTRTNIYDSTFTENSATSGGAIWANIANFKLFGNIVIKNNTATNIGGGIWCGVNKLTYSGEEIYIYDNFVSTSQNNIGFGGANAVLVIDSNHLKDSSKVGIILDSSLCDTVLTNELKTKNLVESKKVLPTVVLDSNSYTSGNTYTLELYDDYDVSAATYKYLKAVKFTNALATGDLEYTISSYNGVYDGNEHGLEINVYNTNDYTVEYSYKDFLDSTFTDDDVLPHAPMLFNVLGNPITVYVKISADGFNEAFGSGVINITSRSTYIVFNNATMEGLNFNYTVVAESTSLTNNLKGVYAIDEQGNAVAGDYYFTTDYTPTISSYSISSMVLKFVPYNINYQSSTANVSTNVTPVFAYEELYYKNGSYYQTKENADAATNGMPNLTLQQIVPFLSNISSITFLTTYTLTTNETFDVGSNSVSFYGWAQGNTYNYNTLIDVAAGKTLTITANQGGKLTIEGGYRIYTAGGYDSLIKVEGTLNLSGNVNIGKNYSVDRSPYSGSGIYNTGTINLNGVQLYQLRARQGGAIYSTGTVTIENCSFSNDMWAGYRGGAIYSNGELTVINCKFESTHIMNYSANSSEDFGGGAIFTIGNMTLRDSTFNSCYIYEYYDYFNGGAVYIGSASTSSITNCKFTNCYTAQRTDYSHVKGGGAIYCKGILTVDNCTFSNNKTISLNGNTLGSDICIEGNKTSTVRNMANNSISQVYITETVTLNIENSYIGECCSVCTTGGVVNLSGITHVSALRYNFYNGTTYQFKVINNGLSSSSRVTVKGLNSMAVNLIAVYNQPTNVDEYKAIFSLPSTIKAYALDITTSGYFGVVENNDVEDIYRLILPTTLMNNYDNANISYYYGYLQTTDYVFLPGYVEGVNVNQIATRFDGTEMRDYFENTSTASYAKATDFAIANRVLINSSAYSWYWLRTAYSGSSVYVYTGTGVGAGYSPNQPYGMRPAMNLDLNYVLDNMTELGVTIDSTNKTITIANIMYPNTKVPNGSALITTLNTAFNAGTLLETGRTYDSYNNGTCKEYYYDGNYYVRIYAYPNNTGNEYTTSDGTKFNQGYYWIKVEPIVWHIGNWDKLPTSINPNGLSSGADTILKVVSDKVISAMIYHSTSTTYLGLWQNSKVRAYLNGYDLAEQNNGSNGYRPYVNSNYAIYNYKGTGFIDAIWHTPEEAAYWASHSASSEEGEEATPLPNTLIDDGYIVKTALANNGYNNSNSALPAADIATNDYVWLPTQSEYTTMATNIGGNSTTYRRVSPTDFMLANYGHKETNVNPPYNSNQGTTHVWLRNAYDYQRVYRAYYDGSTGGNLDYYARQPAEPYWMGVRPAINLSLTNVLNASSTLNYIVDNSKKTIYFPNIMYPQTKVDGVLSSILENNFQLGNLEETGRTFGGLSSGQINITYNKEYLYNNNYYVRTYVYRYSTYNFSDGTAIPNNGSYVWIKVEPIVWYITNWANMPTSINESGDGTATTLTLLSQYALCNIGYYYNNNSDQYRTTWQNSRYRAFLNGYNLAEQNNGTNGSATYKTATQADFKGKGFLDSLWHTVYSQSGGSGTPTGTVVYFNPNAATDGTGLTYSQPVNNITSLATVLNNNSGIDTICLMSTLTIDDAFVSLYGSKIDFKNCYLTNFYKSNDANNFTGNHFNVTTTSADISISNFKVDATKVDLYNDFIASIYGLKFNANENANLTLNNIEICNCANRALNIAGRGTIKINNGKFCNNSYKGEGSVLYVYNTANYFLFNLTFENCVFENNYVETGTQSNAGGGAIYVYNQGAYPNMQLTLKGCTFNNNIARHSNSSYQTYGGAVYFCNNNSNNNEATHVKLNIEDCLFEKNITYRLTTLMGYGGAIYFYDYRNVDEISLIMNNSKFSENQSYYGGVIYIQNNGSYIRSKIKNCSFVDNYASNYGGAIYSGYFEAENCIFTGNKGQNYGGVVYGNYCSFTNCEMYNNTASCIGGAVYGGVVILKNCNLYSNSSTGIFSGSSSGSEYGGGAVSSWSKLVMEDCNVYNNTAAQYGGGVYTYACATIIIKRCNIYDNRSPNYAGIYIRQNYNNGTVINCTMTDCNIYNNVATSSYGAAMFSGKTGSTFTLTNTSFINNSAQSYAGIYVSTGGTISNCTFINNVSSSSYGAIYNASPHGSLTVKNSKFIGNASKSQYGGAIYSQGAINIESCLFEGNSAQNYGGAIYINFSVSNTSTANIIIRNSNFYNNTSTTSGSAVYIYRQESNALTRTDYDVIEGCNFVGNSSTGNPGSVLYFYVSAVSNANLIWTTNFIVKNCTFSNNISTNSSSQGGAIYVYLNKDVNPHPTLNVLYENCMFNENTVYGNGGALYFYSNYNDFDFNVDVNKCTFNKNIAKGSQAGAIYVSSKLALTLNDCVISGNKATNNGVVYSLFPVTFNNCTIYNNTANVGAITNNTSTTSANEAITFNNCNIYSNIALEYGIVNTTKTATFNNCVVSGNNSPNAIFRAKILTVTNSTIANNNVGSGLIYYATSGENNAESVTFENCLIYGNTYYYVNNTLGYNLLAFGITANGQTVALIKNCEIFNNVGVSDTKLSYAVCNLGADVLLSNIRITNNLTNTGSGYNFVGVFTKAGSTNIDNGNFSFNYSDNLNVSHDTSEDGLLSYSADIESVVIKDIKFKGNNLGDAGAVVSANYIEMANCLFEENTGRLATLNNTNMFNIIVSSNNFDGESGFVVTGTFNMFNLVVENNTNGACFYTAGVGTMENIVADNNTALEGENNKGAVVNNEGVLTISSGNSLITKFLQYIVAHDVTFVPQTTITNNVSTLGGAIYNNGTLTLLNVTVGQENNGNTANYGGSIYNYIDGNLTINNSTLQYNTAEKQSEEVGSPLGNGGAIYNLGNLIFNSGTIANNTAQNGGAIYNLGVVTINNGAISFNKASLTGAGIANVVESLDTTGNGETDTTFTGALMINKGEISANELLLNNGRGSGVYNEGSLTINDGTFANNTHSGSTTTYGGAVYAMGKENNINGGNFLTNYATYGGAFYISADTVLNVSNIYLTVPAGAYYNGTQATGCITMLGDETGALSALNFSNSYVTDGAAVGLKNVVGVINIQADSGSEDRLKANVNISNVKFEDLKLRSIVYLSANGANYNVNMSLDGCVITGYELDANRPALYLHGAGNNVEITNCEFLNNSAIASILISSGTINNLVLERCVFRNNLAISIINSAKPTTIKDCVFEDNSCDNVLNLTTNVTSTYENILNNVVIRNNTGVAISLKNKLTFVGNNEITNNMAVGEVSGVVLTEVLASNTKPISLGYGGKLVINNNYLLTASTSADYDVKIGELYYKKSTQMNLNIPKGLNILSGGLQRGSVIGLTIAELAANDVVFTGVNITSKDFEAFHLDNSEVTLRLNNNEVLLNEIVASSVIVSNKVYTIDGLYHILQESDFAVYNSSGVKLVNTEDTTAYTVVYSLTQNGEYTVDCPKFIDIGENTIYYKVYEGDGTTETELGSGSTVLSIVKKYLSLVEQPTAYISRGKALSTTYFVGGLVVDSNGNVVAGSWAFNNGSTIPSNTTTNYALTFTPASPNTYSNAVTASIPVSYKMFNVSYKTVGGVKGFYNLETNTYTGFNKIEDVMLYISKDGVIEITETYIFETNEKVVANENLHIVWNSNTNAFQVGSGANIQVEFTGNGKVYFDEKAIDSDIYLFTVADGSKLVLSNIVVSNFVKTFANESNISSLIYNEGTMEINGATFINNKVTIINKESAYGGIIYNAGVVNLNSGKFADNTLNNNNLSGTAYGGVVYNNNGTVNLNGGTYSYNSAYGVTNGFGGVVYNTNDGSVNINSGIFASNSAVKGGVVANNQGMVVINGGTMMFNKASQGGDVVYVDTSNANAPVYYNGYAVALNSANSLAEFNNSINTVEIEQSTNYTWQTVMCGIILAFIVLVFVRFYVVKIKRKFN